MDRSLVVRRVAPVAVFAAVLGGVVLVNRTGGDGARRAPRALPIHAASGTAGRASDASAPRTGEAAPAYWSRVHVPDRLLEGVPTEGPAYAVRPDASRVGALAKALGVEGEPRKQDGTWRVGSGDRVLQVMPYAGSPWYLGSEKPEARPGTVEAEPAAPATATAKPDEPVSSGTTPPDTTRPGTPPPDQGAPPTCPSAPPGAEPYCAKPVPMPQPTMAPQPSDATARSVMDRVLAAVGQQDAAVTTTPGYLGKEVTAAPVVAGLPTTGYETRVTVDAGGGVVHASGYLARLERDATYPLLDPRKSVERGSGGYARDIAVGRPVEAPAEPAPVQTAEDMPLIATAPPATPHGDPTPAAEPSPAVREATSLRLGLMFTPSYESQDAAFLVPAWLLGFEETTWEEPYLALPDEYVATPPAPSGDPDKPVCDPSPCPTRDAPPPPDGSGGGTSGSSGGYDPNAAVVDTSPSRS